MTDSEGTKLCPLLHLHPLNNWFSLHKSDDFFFNLTRCVFKLSPTTGLLRCQLDFPTEKLHNINLGKVMLRKLISLLRVFSKTLIYNGILQKRDIMCAVSKIYFRWRPRLNIFLIYNHVFNNIREETLFFFPIKVGPHLTKNCQSMESIFFWDSLIGNYTLYIIFALYEQGPLSQTSR